MQINKVYVRVQEGWEFNMNIDLQTIGFASTVFLVAENKINEAHAEINKIISSRGEVNSLRKDLLHVSELQGRIEAWKEIMEYIANGMFYAREGCVS